MLCFDESANQYFMVSDEQVKIVERQMNDILKRMISEGKEIITLSDVMDALGIENRNQNNDDDQKKGVIVMSKKFKMITMAEFLEATRTKDDCWLFKDNGPECNFSKSIPDPEDDDQTVIYYFDDGKDTIHSFKEMDGEIWHAMRQWSRQNTTDWSMWQPWTGREW